MSPTQRPVNPIDSARGFLLGLGIFLPFLCGQPVLAAPPPPAPSSGSASSTVSAKDSAHGHIVQLFWKKEEIYDHNAQTLTLTGGARAIRNGITWDADTLIGYLRKKKPVSDQTKQPEESGTGSLELYRIEGRGHVHLYNGTDQAWGDHGLYDIDRNMMLLTGRDLHVLTPKEVITARDLMEYYPETKISVARGDATVTSKDGRRVTADILQSLGKTGATAKKGGSSLEKAYGWGHVTLRTKTQTAIGDRGVYLFDPELGRLLGNVHITEGQNQNNGSQALVNMKTGISTMLPGGNSPIQGLIMPNESK